MNPKAQIETRTDGTITVQITWPNANVDRIGGYGIGTGKNMKLAQRLARAVDDGVVMYDATIATDVYGKTYVAAKSRVLARILNADLKRLGY